MRGRLARAKARLRDRLTRRGIALAAVLAELAEPGPAVAAARPFAACLANEGGVPSPLSALLALGGAMLALATLADDPREPTARPASAQPPPPPTAAPAKPEPEPLASFRGGGPTDRVARLGAPARDRRAARRVPRASARSLGERHRRRPAVADHRRLVGARATSRQRPRRLVPLREDRGRLLAELRQGRQRGPPGPGGRPRDARCVRRRLGQPPGRRRGRQARARAANTR